MSSWSFWSRKPKNDVDEEEDSNALLSEHDERIYRNKVFNNHKINDETKLKMKKTGETGQGWELWDEYAPSPSRKVTFADS